MRPKTKFTFADLAAYLTGQFSYLFICIKFFVPLVFSVNLFLIQLGLGFNRFLETFVEATRALVVGDPLHDSTQVGPMVSAKQREGVEEYIDIARREGGRILCGGDRPQEPGYYLAPTIVEGLGSSARVCQDEIFGPVACVIPFRDEQEAIELANDTKYGLSGSLWTKDLERALRVARAVQSRFV